jgi:hypothetical protein
MEASHCDRAGVTRYWGLPHPHGWRADLHSLALRCVCAGGKPAYVLLYDPTAVVLGVALVVILVISTVATLMWRKRVVLRRRDETPEDSYRRAIPDLLGGGIHPGGQPSKPPRPNNLSGGGGAY